MARNECQPTSSAVGAQVLSPVSGHICRGPLLTPTRRVGGAGSERRRIARSRGQRVGEKRKEQKRRERKTSRKTGGRRARGEGRRGGGGDGCGGAGEGLPVHLERRHHGVAILGGLPRGVVRERVLRLEQVSRFGWRCAGGSDLDCAPFEVDLNCCNCCSCCCDDGDRGPVAAVIVSHKVSTKKPADA